jgi:RNA 2',3'-cyclic 3'-phosphodiesterase
LTAVARPHRPLRLFTALWPRQPVRDAIALWQREWQWPQRATVVARERLHITLHFLGDVSVERLDELRAALRMRCEPFRLDFGRAEIWGGGIAVLSPEQTPEVLEELHTRIGAALAAAGLVLDGRPYRPHVTLARRASGAKPPTQDLRLRWDVDDFVLVESLPGGSGYKMLDRFGQM